MISKMLLSLAMSHMKTDFQTLLGLLRTSPHPTGLSQCPLGAPKPSGHWRKISAEFEALSLLPYRSAGLNPVPRMNLRVFLQPHSCHLVLFLESFWHQLVTCKPVLLTPHHSTRFCSPWSDPEGWCLLRRCSSRPEVTLGSQLLVP